MRIEVTQCYKNYCNILGNVIKNAKFKYEKDVIKKNSKLGKTSKPTTAIKHIYEDEQKIENRKEIANSMNKYFYEVALDLSNKIKRPTNKNLTLPERNPKTIFCEPTHIYEISKTIHELKTKRAVSIRYILKFENH